MAYVDKRNRSNVKNSKVKKYFIKKRNKPLVLVFDENERQTFLTGFRKRKLQRKKKAQEDLEAELKAAKKRIKQQARDALKKLVARNDESAIDDFSAEAEVVDMGSHQVHVTQLDPQQLAKQNNWIGSNQIKYEVEEEQSENESEEEDKKETKIHGMEADTSNRSNSTKGNKRNLSAENLRTQKDVKRFVKKVATQQVKTSKAFQRKKNVEKVKNKKKKAREEHKQEKNSKKSRKRRNRNRNNEA